MCASNGQSDDLDLTSVFEERAENLSKEELLSWTTYTSHDEENVAKLMGPGTKLLTGPRGSGKSTLLKTAYFRLLESRAALPVYVNYSKSLALEPMFHHNANALQLFRQWVLFKIIVATNESHSQLSIQVPSSLRDLAQLGTRLIANLEIGNLPDTLDHPLAPSELVSQLEAWIAQMGANRCVLLLDDAAHAFSFEQQREFFEILRALRSRRISAKAAVYPGITSYSPTFNVGHEAESLEAWYRPEDPEYLPAMRKVVEKRISPKFATRLVL